MGLFSKLKSSMSRRERSQRDATPANADFPAPPMHPAHRAPPTRDVTRKLPDAVLTQIFSFVCPHAFDYSYDALESSTNEGCMLCDARDLASCTQVCRRWYPEAHRLLQELSMIECWAQVPNINSSRYTNIRIDPVHYCEREVILSEKRKRRSRFDRNADPIDAPQVRIELLMRSVREIPDLGKQVLSLRLPYMTREANKATIARTISVLSNLRYVDLPAGLYSDEHSCMGLKQELMYSCPDIRRMSYRQGAESSFAQLPDAPRWTNLEQLELSGLRIEPAILRYGLGTFLNLRELTLEGFPSLDDSAFVANSMLPPFPALEKLTIKDAPQLTANGLLAFLSSTVNRNTLRVLSISSTGVLPSSLHQVFAVAPQLTNFSIVQHVSRSFLSDKVPPMKSRSLQQLHYEITSKAETRGLPPASSSYYTYLRSSLVAGGLPAVRDLYVRDARFPETLLLAPPPTIGDHGLQRAAGISQPLSVYSKGPNELEWNFTPYEPGAGMGHGTTRPVSLQDAQLSRPWGGDARKSTLVGNGLGGFLAVPEEGARPRSTADFKRSTMSRQDLWR